MRSRAPASWAGLLVLGALGAAHAQSEALRALIGTWHGRVDVRADPERTLVIKSIGQRDGQWIADMHYGTTGKGLSRLRGRVDLAAGMPTLTFTTSADNPVELKLVAEHELRGTLRVWSGAGGPSDRVDRDIRLKKKTD